MISINPYTPEERLRQAMARYRHEMARKRKQRRMLGIVCAVLGFVVMLTLLTEAGPISRIFHGIGVLPAALAAGWEAVWFPITRLSHGTATSLPLFGGVITGLFLLGYYLLCAFSESTN